MCPKAQDGPGNPDLLNHEWCSSKAQINGTTVHVTAIFGMTLSGLVIDDIYHRVLKSPDVANAVACSDVSVGESLPKEADSAGEESGNESARQRKTAETQKVQNPSETPGA